MANHANPYALGTPAHADYAQGLADGSAGESKKKQTPEYEEGWNIGIALFRDNCQRDMSLRRQAAA